MGNTVGSQINLSLEQKEVLIGTILGDGILERHGNYTRLRVCHGKKQKNYTQWKYNIFCNLTTNKVKCFPSEKHWKTGKIYYYCKFDTICAKELNWYHKIFYVNGIKQVPKNIINLLTKPLSLAVWFMDDGYKRNDCNALRISTDSFTLNEQFLLQECLEKNFKIKSKIHKKGRYWNIYISEPEGKNFCRIIKPYIIPEMEYKICLTP